MFFPLWHCDLRESLRLRRNVRFFSVESMRFEPGVDPGGRRGWALTALAVIAVFVVVDEIIG
jgi:hypothetical protein